MPVQTALRRFYDREQLGQIKIMYGQQKSWSPCLRTIMASCYSTNGAVAFSPDGSQVAAADSENIQVRDAVTCLVQTTCDWDVAAGLGISAMINPPKLIISFSPDGRYILVILVQLVAGEYVAVESQLWDMVVGIRRHMQRREDTTSTSALEDLGDPKLQTWFDLEKWSLKGLEKMLIPRDDIRSVGSDIIVKGQALPNTFISNFGRTPLALTPDGQLLASLTGSDLRLWDLALTGNGSNSECHESVSELVSSTGGTHFACVLHDGRFQRRSLKTGAVEWQYQFPNAPYINSISPDFIWVVLTYRKRIPSGADDQGVSVCIINLAKGEMEFEMTTSFDHDIVCGSRDHVAVVDMRLRDAVTLDIWNVATRTVQVTKRLPGVPWSSALSSSHFAFCTSEDPNAKTHHLWLVAIDTGDMQQSGVIPAHFNKLQFSPDGKYLTTFEEVIDMTTGMRHNIYGAREERYLTQGFSVDSKLMARCFSAMGYEIKVFELSIGQLRPKSVFRGHWSLVTNVFSSEGDVLPLDRFHSVSEDGWLMDGNGTRKCWVPENYRIRQTFYGTTLVLGGTDGLLLLDVN